MPTGPSDTVYVEFHLVDPTELHKGDFVARKMAIGVLLSSKHPLSGRRDIPRSRILAYARTATDRAILSQQATISRTWYFYYCSLCAGQLTRTRCLSCARTYTLPAKSHVGAIGVKQPEPLPTAIVAYAIQQGHRFDTA